MKRIYLLLLILASAIRAEDSGSTLTTRAIASTQRPVCTNNNWAPSSAFYFLLALALGCLSHPQGSLIFTRSSRLWRLSPLFLLIENVQIFLHIFQCVRSQGWKDVRVYAYAILALREGNAWCQGEYDTFFSDEGNERFLEQEEDSDNGGLAGSTGVDAVLDGNESRIQMDGLEPSSSRFTRRKNTTALGEGRRSASSSIGITAVGSQVGDPGRISLDDWFTIGRWNLLEYRFTTGRWVPFSESDRNLTHDERVAGMDRMSALADKKAAQLLDARFRKNLEQVQDFEKGPTYRLIIWYPMVQQLAKATQVGFSGAWFTLSVGMLFLLSFGIVEALLFAVRKPLDGDGREKALKLLRKWGAMKREPVLGMKTWKFSSDKKIGMLLEPVAGKWWPFDSSDINHASVLVAIASVANFALFCLVWNIHPFQIVKQLLSSFAEVFRTKPVQTPWYYWWPLMVLIAVMMLVYLPFMIFIWIFSLVFLAAVPICISVDLASQVLKYQRYFSKSPDRQIYRFNPAVTASTTALLVFVAYFGLGASGGLSYDCSTTVQYSFYNLLG